MGGSLCLNVCVSKMKIGIVIVWGARDVSAQALCAEARCGAHGRGTLTGFAAAVQGRECVLLAC